MMDRGGIHDHVAQGFARYSTDRSWHVPHFEKMLYDQVMILYKESAKPLNHLLTLDFIDSQQQQLCCCHLSNSILPAQAQLVHVYLDAFLVSREERFANVVRDIIGYVIRDLSHQVYMYM